jgi:predicted Zn-dependent protease
VLTFVVASPAQEEHQSPQPRVTLKITEESTEVDTSGDEVISVFAGKRFRELREILNMSESPNWSEQYRNVLTARLRERAEMRVINDPHATAALRERLLPVLLLFESENIEIVIFDDAAPNALTLPGVQIAFSTGLIKLIRSQDDLWFVAAHELAHKYTGIAAAFAQATRDLARLRKIELICDTVAASALAELGRDPRSGKATVARALAANTQSAAANDGSGTHPSYRERIRVIEMMSRRLGRGRVTGGRNINSPRHSRMYRDSARAGAR